MLDLAVWLLTLESKALTKARNNDEDVISSSVVGIARNAVRTFLTCASAKQGWFYWIC